MICRKNTKKLYSQFESNIIFSSWLILQRNEKYMEYKNSKIEENIILKIRNLRMEHGLSQQGLSNVLGVSEGQIGNIESPRFQHKYTLKQIYKFCEFIDYPFERIFLTDDELSSSNKTNLLIERIIEYEG